MSDLKSESGATQAMRRRLTFTAVAGGLALFALPLIVYVVHFQEDPLAKDEQALSGKLSTSTARQLVTDRSLIGLSRLELIGQIGEPDHSGGDELVYETGKEWSILFGPEAFSLTIQIKEDRVQNAYMVDR